MNVQMPPPSELVAVCDCIDHMIATYLSALSKGRVELGRFESEIEAYTLQKLILRHSEAVVLMARHDMVLIPTANVAARSCFETHIKLLWMLKPIDPFEREARWVVHLKSASEQWSKFEKNGSTPEESRSKFAAQKKTYEDFSGEIARLLSAQGYQVPIKLPTLWDMLRDIGAQNLYAYYTLLSSYTHSNFEAASLYRKNLGIGKELGEFISARDWSLPTEVIWKSFFHCAQSILQLIEAPSSAFDQEALVDDFESKIEKLRHAQPDASNGVQETS